MIHKEIDDRKDINNKREKIKMTTFSSLDNHENGDNTTEINPSPKYSKNIIYWVDLLLRI